MESSGAVVDMLFNGLQDLGSNPRSPTYFLSFSFRYSSVSHALQCTILPQISKRQMASRPNLMAQMGCLPYTQVNQGIGNLEVNPGLLANGPLNCQSHSLSRPNTPLVISFFFLLFNPLFY